MRYSMQEYREVKINYQSVGEQAHIPLDTGPFWCNSYQFFANEKIINTVDLEVFSIWLFIRVVTYFIG